MNKRIIISVILVIIWMAFIYFMSNMNREESSSTSRTIIVDVINKIDEMTHASSETIKKHQTYDFIKKVHHIFRKFSHTLVYMALAILIFNLLIQLRKRKLFMYNLLTIMLCFIYACTDEYHQTFILGRGGQFTDILIDTLGAIVGCFLISMVYLIVKKHQKKRKLNYNLL